MHDLVIRGGTVVDGTGEPARTADIAITNGVVTEVGKVGGAARETLDADGLLVTPGVVDVHTHFDGQLTWDEMLTPTCWHGVTTVVVESTSAPSPKPVGPPYAFVIVAVPPLVSSRYQR